MKKCKQVVDVENRGMCFKKFFATPSLTVFLGVKILLKISRFQSLGIELAGSSSSVEPEVMPEN